MPLDPVKIPQNIYVEDRIFGPVSLRQIILILIGGGISYACWSIAKSVAGANLIVTVISWSPAAIAAAFAFIKIHHLSLFRLCLLLMEKSEKPNIRVWTARTGVHIDLKSYYNLTAPKKESDIATEKKEKQVGAIAELSQILDANPYENLSQSAQTAAPTPQTAKTAEPTTRKEPSSPSP